MKRCVLSLIMALILLFSVLPVYGENADILIGNLVADSYIYEAKLAGITDIDVSIAVVDKEASETSELCNESTLLIFFLTGSELEDLAEYDVSRAGRKSGSALCFSGLRFKYNSYRVSGDRVLEIRLCDEFGISEERNIEKNELYKICCDSASAEQLCTIKGRKSVQPKYSDGLEIADLSEAVMHDLKGGEVSAELALSDYQSFLTENPNDYTKAQGRKINTQAKDIESRLMHPGLSTWIVILISAAVIAAIIIVLKYFLPKWTNTI